MTRRSGNTGRVESPAGSAAMSVPGATETRCGGVTASSYRSVYGLKNG
jgi:hypothetical protein